MVSVVAQDRSAEAQFHVRPPEASAVGERPVLSVGAATIRARPPRRVETRGDGMSEPVGVQVGRICTACGREDSIPLIWGMPGSEDFRLAERGLVSLGGCLVSEEQPVLT